MVSISPAPSSDRTMQCLGSRKCSGRLGLCDWLELACKPCGAVSGVMAATSTAETEVVSGMTCIQTIVTKRPTHTREKQAFLRKWVQQLEWKGRVK